MRKLLIAAILLFACHCFAQCPFTATLQNKGSFCLGHDTLVVSSVNKVASIKWYKDGVLDTTVNAGKNIIAFNPNGVVVAGGNGPGAAANQITPRTVTVDGSGNIYVGDFQNYRVQKFPPNSTIANDGVTIAGCGGYGNGTNQLYAPVSICLDAFANLYVAQSATYIQKFPAASVTCNPSTIAAANMGNALSVFVDGNGYVYVIDGNNNELLKFPPNATSTTIGSVVAGGNGKGSAANQFDGAEGVFVDGIGNIYVADANNNRIQKFIAGSNSATNGITVAGGNGKGGAANQLNNPLNVFVDGSGNIYVPDGGNSRVQKFPPNSTQATNGTTVIGGAGSGINAVGADALFIDANGYMYVADVLNYRIKKYTPLTTSNIDSTRIPTSTGTYYAVVTDTAGCTVTTNSITVSPPLQPTISIGTYGSASVCYASNSINFVAYTTNGGTVPAFQWQVNGINAGTNSATFSAAVAYNDVVSCILTSNAACALTPTAVANDTVIYGIQKAILTNKGSICTGGDTLVLNSKTRPYSIKWYKDGMLDTTLQVTKTGYANNGITVAGGNGRGKANNQFMGSTSMTLDAMGNIYADDSYLSSRILKFPPNSTSATYGATVVNGLTAVPTIVPLSTHVDVAGNIYMLGAANRGVLKLVPGSSVANILSVAGNGPGTAANQFTAYAFCVDNSGYIYVADFGSQRILKFPPNATSATNGVVVAGGNGTGLAANQLNQPFCVAVDNAGNIYVADYNNNRIQKFPPNSTSATNGITVAGGNGVGTAANQFSGPIWVNLDANGNMLVADQLNNRIQKFPPNSSSTTNGVTVAGGNGNGPAANQLATPCAVVVDSSGNIYVSDYQNLRIQKFLVNTTTLDTTYISTLPGTYTAVITDSAGCSITSNAITITPSVQPSITISTDKPSVCAGSAMGFMAFASNTTDTPNYQWQANGVDVGTNSIRYTSTSLSTGDAVTCIVTNNGTCGGSDTSNIIIAQVNALPVLGPAKDASIALGQSVVLNIPVTGNIASYLWTPAVTLSNNLILNPTATPTRTTVYTLKVVSIDSCVASDSLTVTVSSNIYFTSGFTPNGDGRNDVFYVLGGLAGDKIKDFSIFDRWGKRLFQVQNVLPNDRSAGWDGRFNGTLLQSGNYIYVATITSANGTEKQYEGTVMLMR